jgi:hypothetical protein
VRLDDPGSISFGLGLLSAQVLVFCDFVSIHTLLLAFYTPTLPKTSY